MSTKTARGTSVASSNAGAPFKSQSIPFLYPKWVRNKAWPALPSITSSDEKVVGLFAVWPGNNNWSSMQFNVNSGTVSIDWGDGSTSTPASGAQTDHAYDFADTDLAGTDKPVTFTDSGDKVGLTAHPYSNGDVVRFYNIVSTTGITDATPYYVVNANTNDFQVSLTSGGSALALTTDGTGTMLPYKVAVVTVTPTTGGSVFSTVINVALKHSTPTNAYTNGWLDIALSTTANTVPNFSNTSSVSMSHYLERVNILKTGAASFNSAMFNAQAAALVVFTLGSASSLTSMTSAFGTCISLREVTLGTTGVITSFDSTFTGCASLQIAPALSMTSSCTSTSQMFSACVSLVSVPNNFDTTGVTNAGSMFSGCRNLVNAPQMKLTAATTIASMFLNCASLQNVPNYVLSAATTCTSVFQNCASLITAPLLTFASSGAVDVTSMFSGCSSLKFVPVMGTTANVTNVSSMFQSCVSLETVPLFVTSGVLTFTSMFSSCTSLASVPLFVTTAGTSFSSMFASCTTLQTVPKFDLGAATNLSSMFSGCSNLFTVPLFSTASCVNFSSMFANCFQLSYLPNFNTSAASNTYASIINTCQSMREVPAWDMSKATSSSGYTSCFTSCRLTRIKATGIKFTFTVANNNLDSTGLDEVYTNLASVTSQTITVSGNHGITGDTPSIATGKGWTVTGS